MGERMKKFFISLIAGLLGASAAIGTSSIYAAETRMQIEASMEEPIQISANEEGYDGDLHIEVESSYEIERDYDQNLMLTVTNISDQARAYYMAVDHSYADLSVNFIKGGSQSEPLLIEPGESQQVDRSRCAKRPICIPPSASRQPAGRCRKLCLRCLCSRGRDHR